MAWPRKGYKDGKFQKCVFWDTLYLGNFNRISLHSITFGIFDTEGGAGGGGVDLPYVSVTHLLYHFLSPHSTIAGGGDLLPV